MSLHSVDLENWKEYDERKMVSGTDRHYFACTDEWEIAYLISKVRQQYPSYSIKDTRKALVACCISIPPPRPRALFVECMLKNMGIIK